VNTCSEKSSVDEDVEKLELGTLLMGTSNGAATVEMSSVIPQNIKHPITILYSNSTSMYIPNGTEIKDSNKYVYNHVCVLIFSISKR
jgi:hypothetical protein